MIVARHEVPSEGPAPQGLQDSAQGFNRVSTLGTQTNGSPGRGERGGYQMKLAPIALQKSEYAIGTCYNWTIGPRFRLVRTFDLAPPSGRAAPGGRSEG
jgi:hypothetical protein